MILVIFLLPSLFHLPGIVSKNCDALKRNNLALYKSAQQSSMYVDFTRGLPGKAVDGITNGGYSSCRSCSHTHLNTNPWWMVDLGAEYTIQEVLITNRAGDNGLRLRDFTIAIASSTIGSTLQSPVLCYKKVGPQTTDTAVYPCVNGSTPGRYVKITIQGLEYLTLCEVQVYGPYFHPDPAVGEITCADNYVLYQSGALPNISPLLRSNETTRLRCATLCLATENCVSFTVNLDEDGFGTCQLFDCQAFEFEPQTNCQYFVQKSVVNNGLN